MTDQLQFNYLLGNRQSFRLQEVAKIIGLSRRTVEELFDQGQLWGHRHNASRTPAAKLRNGPRQTKTVCRESLELYLVRTATYDSPMRVEAIESVLKTCTLKELIRLRTAINQRFA